MGQINAKDVNRYVQSYYSTLYEEASSGRLSSLPITTGKDLAILLGYPDRVLRHLPESYWGKFVPCGNPLPHIQPKIGDKILNLGCGAALDSLCLQTEHGNSIGIVGLDAVFSILGWSRTTFRLLGESIPLRGNFGWVCGDAEHLPFRADSFDWIILNGVFNLFKDKLSLLGDIWRVLKPEGNLVGVDLCCSEPLPDYFIGEMDAWAWCMSGACTAGELHSLLRTAGFKAGHLIREEEAGPFYRVTFTCFKSTTR